MKTFKIFTIEKSTSSAFACSRYLFEGVYELHLMTQKQRWTVAVEGGAKRAPNLKFKGQRSSKIHKIL